jgi:hypothetical protein
MTEMQTFLQENPQHEPWIADVLQNMLSQLKAKQRGGE